jgi:hypothetical protein
LNCADFLFRKEKTKKLHQSKNQKRGIQHENKNTKMLRRTVNFHLLSSSSLCRRCAASVTCSNTTKFDSNVQIQSRRFNSNNNTEQTSKQTHNTGLSQFAAFEEDDIDVTTSRIAELNRNKEVLKTEIDELKACEKDVAKLNTDKVCMKVPLSQLRDIMQSCGKRITKIELEITQLQKELEEKRKQRIIKSQEAMEHVANLKEKEARDQILWFVATKMHAINIEFQQLYVTEYPQNVTRYHNGEINWNDVADIPDAYHMWGSDIVAVFKKLMTTKHNIPPRSDQEWAELGLAVAKLASFCYFRSAQNVSPEDVYWALRDTDVDEHVKPLIVSLVMASS